jgi:DUF305 family protein family protein
MSDKSSLMWIFIGGVILGIYFNASYVLADDYSHIYFGTMTLVYSVLFMASNVTILKILISYWSSGYFDTSMFLAFLTLSALMLYMLHEQVFVDERQWLKRMITHHSGAIKTSKKILERTDDEDIKSLAEEIIVDQEEDIDVMQDLLAEND